MKHIKSVSQERMGYVPSPYCPVTRYIFEKGFYYEGLGKLLTKLEKKEGESWVINQKGT